MKVSVEGAIKEIEKRFKSASKLPSVNMESYPLEKNSKGMQVLTNKSKSDEHGEVFTPLWLVDSMLERLSNTSWKDQSLATEDLCSGYGQFTVRMLRKKYEVLKERFDIKKFLMETHLFVECQPNSCFRLLYIFGRNIRLLIGDASKKGLLPDDAEVGVWVWSDVQDKWYDGTVRIQEMSKKHNNKNADISINAIRFEEEFLKMKKELEQK